VLAVGVDGMVVVAMPGVVCMPGAVGLRGIVCCGLGQRSGGWLVVVVRTTLVVVRAGGSKGRLGALPGVHVSSNPLRESRGAGVERL